MSNGGLSYNRDQSNKQAPRKTIVVVGKKDHGKTAFVNMIKIGSPVIDQAVPLSDAPKFTLYKVNSEKIPSRKEKDLFVMDTPGFTSKSSLFVDVERLERFITANSLQIVTVAYMLDIDKGREKDEHGEGVLFNFLQLLKLKVKVKKDIIICVLPHFDERYKKVERNNALQRQFQLDFKANGLEEIWQNRIEWMSRPECDSEHYDDIIARKTDKNQTAHNSEKVQWRKFQKQLSRVIQKQFYPSIQHYLTDMQEFNSKKKSNVGKLYTQQSSFVRGTFEVEFDVSKNELKERSIPAKYAYPIATVAGCAFFACGAVVVHYSLEDKIIPYFLDLVFACFFAYAVCRICLSLEQISFNIDKNDQPKVDGVLTTQVAGYLRNNIESSTKFQNNTARVDRLPGITNVSAVMVNKDQKQGSVICFERNGESYEGKICEEGTLRLIYEVQIPTKESYQLFLKKEVQSFYG